jgi:PHD/YefM family antitoxin component YafN of YafNO toxin-antitoxin module
MAVSAKESLLNKQEIHIIRIIRIIRKKATMRVTTAEFIKNYGSLADKALMEPVTITKNGRDRLVVVSAEEYSRLARRDQRVIQPEELTKEQVALIAKAEVPAEYAHLDAEVGGVSPYVDGPLPARVSQ